MPNKYKYDLSNQQSRERNMTPLRFRDKYVSSPGYNTKCSFMLLLFIQMGTSTLETIDRRKRQIFSLHFMTRHATMM